MRIIAIDPGCEQSAYVVLDGSKPIEFKTVENETMRLRIMRFEDNATLVIERVASFGMPVGAEVFETVYWSGRFAEAFKGGNVERLKRHEIKMHLCGNMRAKDGNIRQALIDKFGGKEKAIGRKGNYGPLHGMSGDVWSALAVGITWLERSSGIST